MTSQEHEYSASWTHNGLKVIECRTCGFRHLYPIPTKEQLATLYRQQFGGDVRQGFAQRKKEDEAYWNLAFERRLASYRRLLGAGRLRSPRILDIGCGTGNLLRYFRGQGWGIQGIEPSSHFEDALRAEKIPCLHRMVEELKPCEWDALESFDVVNMSMLLEHVATPTDLIRQTIALLKPGGVLTVESPNDFNAFQQIAVVRHCLPPWWITNLHINYFDFESLERLLKAQGMRPAERDAQFPMELFLLMGDQYVGDAELGRSLHFKRVAFEKAMHEYGEGDLLQEMYHALAQMGLGRTCIVHGMKIT